MNYNAKYKLYKRLLAVTPKNIIQDHVAEFSMMRILWAFENKNIAANHDKNLNTYFATVSDRLGNQITLYVGARAKRIYEHGQKSL